MHLMVCYLHNDTMMSLQINNTLSLHKMSSYVSLPQINFIQKDRESLWIKYVNI